MGAMLHFFRLTRNVVACVVALGAPMLASGMVSRADASPAAESFVQTNVQHGLQILNNTGVGRPQREEQFRGFLLGLTDLRRIALYTLGPARRLATPAQQETFVEAFRDYAFAVYGTEFSKYSGQTLRVMGSVERAPGDELVRTQLVDPNAQGQEPIEVDFRVYGSKGHYSVVDIVVAGLDLAITEQEDFSAFLAQHNNDVRALTANLRQRAERVRATGRI
jgi:phospholipid transport system substrate-binding protein